MNGFGRLDKRFDETMGLAHFSFHSALVAQASTGAVS